MRVAIYARVSTPNQDPSGQVTALRDYCRVREFEVVQVFEDVATGATTDRLGFKQLMHLIQRGGVDAVVVQKLDRLGRSLRDLLGIVDTFRSHNVAFVSVNDSIDTTTNNGRLFFYIIASLAEYERGLIYERCEAGKKRARGEGVKFGRPKKLVDIQKALDMINAGIPKRRIAREFKITPNTLYRALNAYQKDNLTPTVPKKP
jgi:DNA invertase Pin-like site-specific DNA recombinase